MEKEFKTAFSRSGNLLTPAVLTITDRYVKWEKRNSYLIGHDSKTIPMDKVATVEIHNKGFGTNITINSNGAGTIFAENLTISDAKEMKALIESMMSRSSITMSNDITRIMKEPTPKPKKKTGEDILNEALADEMELDLEFKRKDLQRAERQKQRKEIQERLKSKSKFIYALKWIWIVLLNKTWKKVFLIIIILIAWLWNYTVRMERIQQQTNIENFNKEAKRLEEVKNNIDKQIEMNNINEAEILLADLSWKSYEINDRYATEAEEHERDRWGQINSIYTSKLDKLKGEAGKAKKHKAKINQ